MKCPFCGCEDVQSLPSNDGIYKNYQKNISSGMTHGYETGSCYYPIVKALCMKCGYVFSKMNDEVLKKYHDEKEFFTN